MNQDYVLMQIGGLYIQLQLVRDEAMNMAGRLQEYEDKEKEKEAKKIKRNQKKAQPKDK